jgi:hypothetical protein
MITDHAPIRSLFLLLVIAAIAAVRLLVRTPADRCA